MRIARCFLISCLLALPASVQAITVRVGATSDPACESFSIPGALARLPADSATHRILLSANQDYDFGGTVTARNVVFEGGYASCSASTPTAGLRTEVGPVPSATAPLIVARGTGSAVTVTLRRIDLIGPAPAGLARAEGSVTLIVEDSGLYEGGGATLAAGGGIEVLADATLVLRGRSEVSGNRADVGAGVRCRSASVHIAGSDVLIAGNRAVAGGGIALDDCELRWDPDTASAQGGINGNLALLGGGLYALDSRVTASTSGGLPAGPRRILANTAELAGGGIYLENTSLELPSLDVSSNRAGSATSPAGQGNCAGLFVANSDLVLDRFRIDGNVARGYGGGACFADRSAMFRETAAPCADGACRSISANRAGTLGGALYLREDALVLLGQLRLTDNVAASGAIVHSIEGTPVSERSRLSLVNAVVARNTATAGTLFSLAASDLDLIATTIADNTTSGALVSDSNNSGVYMAATLVSAPPSTPVFSLPFTTGLLSQCVIAHERASFVQQGADARVATPGFTDAANGDYRLRVGAAAIDACAPFLKDPLGADIGGSARPVDLPTPNRGGPWDIGAYERQFDDDTIFAAGFE